LPHAGDESRHIELYNTIYRNVDVIGHFSAYSRQRISARFPVVLEKEQVVHKPFLFSQFHPVPSGSDALGDRRYRRSSYDCDSLGAILIFGALRHRQEWLLVRRAIRQLNRERVRTVFAGRFECASRMQRWLTVVEFEIWRRRNLVIDRRGFVPQDSLPHLIGSVDAIVIPRNRPHLNSGVLSLAMTMAKGVVAPRYGPYEEYLSGSSNELYEPGDADDLALAIDRISRKSQAEIAAENRAIASDWGWDNAIGRYLSAVGL
jgi:glycosyltransferase involved in cell wall biosynthesis